jgi:hypothetical protein
LPFHQRSDTVIYLPPPPIPVECDDSINQLWASFKNSRLEDLTEREDIKRNIVILIKRIKADKLGDVNIIIETGKPFQGMLENELIQEGNVKVRTETLITDGDIDQAAKSKDHFISFIASLFHEHIHHLQKMKLGLEAVNAHDEREVMAHIFNLFPDQFFSWLNANYPGVIPANFKFCYPTYTTLFTLQQYIHDFIMYYKRLPEEKRRKYRRFFNKVHLLNIDNRSRFLPGKYMPDMTSLNE